MHYHVVVKSEVAGSIVCSGADGRAHIPSYRLGVTVEFGEPVFTFEDSTSQHIGYGEVNTFGYRGSPGIFLQWSVIR